MTYFAKTSWQYDEVVAETDMNRIEQGVADAHDELQNHIGSGGAAHANATAAEAGFMSASDKAALDAATSAPTASTLAKRDAAGRIKATTPAESDDVARKSETDAAIAAAATASSAAVAAQAKADAAHARADAAFQQASEGKSAIAAAITGKGVAATGSDTHGQLASKIGSIQLATGNAVAADVITGKTFSNASTTGATGTMPDRGAIQVTPRTYNQAIPTGYHNGSGRIAGSPNLVAENIKSGINLFGVVGNVVQATGTAPASSVYIGHTASNASGPITGTMPDSSTHITPSAANQVIPAGYHNGTGVVYGDPDLLPENIRAGVELFGVAGTLSSMRFASGKTPMAWTTNPPDPYMHSSWNLRYGTIGFDPKVFLAILRNFNDDSIVRVSVEFDSIIFWHDPTMKLGDIGTPQFSHYRNWDGTVDRIDFGFYGVQRGIPCYCEWRAYG